MDIDKKEKPKQDSLPQWQLEHIAAKITQKTGRYTSPEWVRANVWTREDHPKPGYITFWY